MSGHLAERPAKAHQREREQHAADYREPQERPPHDADARAAIQDRLAQFDEVRGRRGEHDVLHEQRHAFARRAAARKHLQRQQHMFHCPTGRTISWLFTDVTPGTSCAVRSARATCDCSGTHPCSVTTPSRARTAIPEAARPFVRVSARRTVFCSCRFAARAALAPGAALAIGVEAASLPPCACALSAISVTSAIPIYRAT